MKKFYTVKEAAELLDLSTNTIYKYIKEGKIDSRRIGQGRIKIPYSELEPYVPKKKLTSEKSTADETKDNAATDEVEDSKETPPQPAQKESQDEPQKDAETISLGANDIVFIRLFKALFLLGLGAIYFVTSRTTFDFTDAILRENGDTLTFILPIVLMTAGVFVFIGAIRPSKLEKYQPLMHLLSLLALFYFSFISLTTGNYGRLVFSISLAILVLIHLISERGSSDEVGYKSFFPEFTKYALLLSVIGGTLIITFPDLMLFPGLRGFLADNRAIFALVWFGLLVGIPSYFLSRHGKDSKSAPAFYLITGILALIIATQLTIESVWDVSYLSYLTGIFAVFLARWKMGGIKISARKVSFMVIAFLWVSASLVLGILGLRMGQEGVKEAASNKLEGSLDQVLDGINLVFEQQSAVLVSAATDPEVIGAVEGEDEGAAIQEARKVYEKLSSVDRVLIYTEEGVAIGVYPRNSLAQGTDFSSREYFQKTKSTFRGYIAPIFENILGEPVVLQTEPIFRNNQFIGMVAVGGDPKAVVKDHQTVAGTELSIYAVDENDTFVFTPDSKQVGEEAVSFGMLATSQSEDSPDDKLARSGFADKPRWRVVVRANEESLVSATSRMNIALSLALVVNSIFSLTAGVIAASRRRQDTSLARLTSNTVFGGPELAKN